MARYSLFCADNAVKHQTDKQTNSVLQYVPAMGVVLYHWGVMANLAGVCGN